MRPTAKPDTRGEGRRSGCAYCSYVQCFCSPTRKLPSPSPDSASRAGVAPRGGGERGSLLLAHLAPQVRVWFEERPRAVVGQKLPHVRPTRVCLRIHASAVFQDFLRAGLVSFLCVFEHRAWHISSGTTSKRSLVTRTALLFRRSALTANLGIMPSVIQEMLADVVPSHHVNILNTSNTFHLTPETRAPRKVMQRSLNSSRVR